MGQVTKAKAKTYQTHTGLLIMQVQDEDEYVVSVVGDRERELLRTPDKRAATKYYYGLVKHYTERAVAEKVTT